MIAVAEGETARREGALAELEARLAKMRLAMREGQVRLATLRHGLAAARAARALQKAAPLHASGSDSLATAEGMLRRLEGNIAVADETEQALAETEAGSGAVLENVWPMPASGLPSARLPKQ